MKQVIRCTTLAAWTLLGLTGCSRILGLPADPVFVEPEADENEQSAEDDASFDDERNDMSMMMDASMEDPTYSCLDGPAPSTEPEAARSRVRVTVCSFVKPDCTEHPVGLTARLCAKRDVNCSDPLVEDIPLRDGRFEFDVPTGKQGFDGYLQVSSASALCTDEEAFGAGGNGLCALLPACDPEKPDDGCMFPLYPESLIFFNPPVRTAAISEFVVNMAPSAAVTQLVQAGGIEELDPSTGFIFITAYDCVGEPAQGITFSTNRNQDSTIPVYLSGGVISPTAEGTDESGLGGVIGVPPGFAEVTGKLPDGTELGIAGVQIAPFSITYVDLAP